VNLQWGQRGTF